MFCIDSSVLAHYVLQCKNYMRLEKFIKEGITVELAFKETLNVLWKRIAIFKDNVDASLALKRLFILKDALGVVSQENYMSNAFDISMRFNIPIYDSLFIAVSLGENCTLVTMDGKQHEVAKHAGAKVELIKF